ncbi:MAG: SCP2 sterol-binding domain-containing protein [Desulfobacteraceae bacterium]|jgi:predicted secreted protein
MAPEFSASELTGQMMMKANKSKDALLRLRNWNRVIQWVVENDQVFWKTDTGMITMSPPQEAQVTITCSKETLKRIVSQELPFFLALWATGDLEFKGSFSDAHRLGYIFLSDKNDKRKRRVVFLAHCFLNINTRFPEGSAFAGANTPLIQTLLQKEVGIIQMPCPEFLCLGLEKELAGELPESEIRACFRKHAESVVDQIQQYLNLGYEIPGIIGMNPSPSCGVEISKGKGKFLGLDEDTSEKEESGVFIEELQNTAQQRGLGKLPIFGIKRILTGESGMEERLKILDERL